MTKIFDFHTHILPCIDDGSASVEESVAMVRKLGAQGASGIAATPHFYAQRTSPEKFFARREAAWKQLEPLLTETFPEIRLGAEVQYFEGIHRCDGLERFCIEGTGLLLLEMPMCAWTERMVDAVLELNRHGNLTVLLAHIERYMTWQNRSFWQPLLEGGVVMQVSAEFFIRKPGKALKLLKDGKIHVLGSDAHNMNGRSPNLAPALEVIARRDGEKLLRDLHEREAALLGETQMDKNYLRHNGAAVSADMY